MNPAVVRENVTSLALGPMVLSDSESDAEDVSDCQTKLVLVGKGKLVGCLDMITVLIPREVGRELNVLLTDPTLLEKLYPLVVWATVTLPDEDRLVGVRLLVMVEVIVVLITVTLPCVEPSDGPRVDVVDTLGGVIGVVMIESQEVGKESDGTSKVASEVWEVVSVEVGQSSQESV